MNERQVATPTKKRAATKAASTVASKPKTAKSAIAKKPAAKKPVAKKTATTVTEPKKAKAPAVTKAASAEKTKAKLTPEERYRMVETAAYFIAERHGFQGDSTEHWVAAELEVATKLGQ